MVLLNDSAIGTEDNRFETYGRFWRPSEEAE